MAERLRKGLVLPLLALLVVAGCAGEPEPHEFPVFPEIEVYDPPNDKGEVIKLVFRVPLTEMRSFTEYRIERAESDDGPWTFVDTLSGGGEVHQYVNEGATLDSPAPESGKPYWYRVVGVREDGERNSEVAGPVQAAGEWFDLTKLAVFVALLVFSALVFYFIRLAKRNPDVYVRPIGGLAAMSEAIGRATEMGRPVLYVPGIADLSDIQTITSLVIMREVAQQTAEYETPMIVPCRDPVTMTAAEEAVRTGCYEAGKPDFFNPDNVRFLSDEQFAFTAATNGIMMREKPATNVFIGAFWAESLILAETGFLAGAIQIAGTAMVSQLPFFVAACDYTLIGEEIYAASAYLSREPMLMGSLKGSDWAKIIFAVLMLVGTVLATTPRGELNVQETTVAGASWEGAAEPPWKFVPRAEEIRDVDGVSFAEIKDTEGFARSFLPSGADEPVMVRLLLLVRGGDLAVDDVVFREVFEGVPDLPSRITNGNFKKGLFGWRPEGVVRLGKAGDQGKFLALKDGAYILSAPFSVEPDERFELVFKGGRIAGEPKVEARLENAEALSNDYIEFFK